MSGACTEGRWRLLPVATIFIGAVAAVDANFATIHFLHFTPCGEGRDVVYYELLLGK